MSAADKLTESLFKTMQRIQQMLGEDVKEVSTKMDGIMKKKRAQPGGFFWERTI